jgi:hypothetical protein
VFHISFVGSPFRFNGVLNRNIDRHLAETSPHLQHSVSSPAATSHHTMDITVGYNHRGHDIMNEDQQKKLGHVKETDILIDKNIQEIGEVAEHLVVIAKDMNTEV